MVSGGGRTGSSLDRLREGGIGGEIPSALVPGGTCLGLEVTKMVVPSSPSALTAVAPSMWVWSSFLITTHSRVFMTTRRGGVSGKICTGGAVEGGVVSSKVVSCCSSGEPGMSTSAIWNWAGPTKTTGSGSLPMVDANEALWVLSGAGDLSSGFGGSSSSS